jgi:tRNA(Ile2) C34 agmatinyltransferase TiaS
MKGPFGRLQFEVRREWECPVCRRRERTGGHVVTLRCRHCQGKGTASPVWMTLREEPPRSSVPGQEAPPGGPAT